MSTTKQRGLFLAVKFQFTPDGGTLRILNENKQFWNIFCELIKFHFKQFLFLSFSFDQYKFSEYARLVDMRQSSKTRSQGVCLKFAYLTMKNISFARFARASFINQ